MNIYKTIYKSGKLRDISSLGVATFFNTLCLFVSNLIVADLLTISEYGAVRTITSYLFLFVMLGSLTFHDALPARLLRVNISRFYQVIYSTLVALSVWLLIFTICISFLVSSFGDELDGKVHYGLQIMVFLLIFPVCEMVLKSTFQVIGSVRLNFYYLLIFGFINLVFLICGTMLWGFEGWLFGRAASWILMLIIVTTILLHNMGTKTDFDIRSIFIMLEFSKYQMISLILSLCIMSADVIFLEFIYGVDEVAYYGIGLLFVNGSFAVTQVLRRVYFKKLNIYESKTLVEYILLNFLLGLFVAIFLYYLVPYFVYHFYEGKFTGFDKIFNIQCLIIPFAFIFNSLSAVNIAHNNSKRSLMISLFGALFVLILLPIFVLSFKGVGAALAMLCVYSCTSIFGGWLLRVELFKSFWYFKQEFQKRM